ncbi:MAG TPA: hypothetical protein VFF33_10950 [Ignavibacteriaceae bacterium]|nr:hypothetical protein [Ignavibacteriaceae bacterium]
MFNKIDNTYYSDKFFYVINSQDYLLLTKAINENPNSIKELFTDKTKYDFFITFLKELGTSLKFNPISKKEPSSLIRSTLYKLMEENIDLIIPKVIYKKIDYLQKEAGIKLIEEDIAFEVKHKNITENNCTSGVVYITTMGDELLKKNSILFNEGEVFEHYVLNAIISALAEMAANDLQEYLTSNRIIKQAFRLSPGYGNWKLDEQKKLFEVIRHADKIDVHLNEYNVIIPEKSTSGIMFEIK